MGFTIDSAEIANRFGYHRATEETAPKHDALRTLMIETAERVVEITGDSSREQSLAITALQEAAMWSNAAIACHGAPLSPSDSPS